MKIKKGDIIAPRDPQFPGGALVVEPKEGHSMTGTLENFDLTFGSFGHHYSTIDGQRFITWFNVVAPDLKGVQPGCRVEYETRPAPTVLCHCPLVTEALPSAILLRVIQPGG